MKKLRLILALTVMTLTVQSGWSQTDYPNVTSDLAEGQNFTYFLKHRITMPGVWGLGGNTQYMINHLVYAEAEVGYGWVIGEHTLEGDKKFRGWFEVKAGYPIINITKKKNGKWVTKQSDTHDFYYNIDVPAHNSLIALAGFASEPTTIKFYPDPDNNSGAIGSSVQPYSFQAPVFKLGLKWLSFLKANVKVNGKTGSVQRKFEFYAGIIIPSKNEIIAPEFYKNLNKTNKMGYEIMISAPYRLNGWATFDIGIRSLGYNDNGQFYLGNTFYFK